MPEDKLNTCNERINDLVDYIQKKKVKAKLILNFDGEGRIRPELILNNESVFAMIIIKKNNDAT